MSARKWIALFVCVALIFGLAGCGSGRQAEQTSEPKTGQENNVQPNATDDSTEPVPETSGENASGTPDPAEEEHADIAVVVFSATGTTKSVADRIAALTGADLLEIIPAQPYSAEDLRYSDSGSRATKEQNDPEARPRIAEEIALEPYTTVYLGYPIWWGQAPRILSTFVESHDFDGKTVIPFCTSGSSDIGQSDDALAAQAGSGNWLQGKRFSGSVAEEELQKWIDEKTGEKAMNKDLQLRIGETEVSVAWEENESVDALAGLVEAGPLTIDMSMYGGFEQVGPLGASLPRSDKQMTTQAGDIVLYSGDQIVIFYGSNAWAYTRLGRITDRTAAQMAELLGNGDVAVTVY